jgi:hypothetical protein
MKNANGIDRREFVKATGTAAAGAFVGELFAD